MEPKACVVEPRIVRRALRRTRERVSGMHVSHARCYWIDRARFASITSEGERATVPAGDGPLILIARPDSPSELEVERASFHARVHLEVEALRLDEATVRARVHAIGETAFDEIRAVLREDDLLLPSADEIEVWTEFVATFLELARFEPRALSETFPSIDRALAEEVIGKDLPSLVGLSTRQAPSVRPVSSAHPPPGARISRVSAPAELARARTMGNVVRALLDGDVDPRPDLERLEVRLSAAVGADVALAAVLEPVVRIARSRPVPSVSTEGRLLFDLQRAAIAHERAVEAIDPLGAVFSLFQQPVVRPLPASRTVRVRRALGKALAKVPKTDLPREAREDLRDALGALERAGGEQLRGELRPVLLAALTEVGLRPRGVAEEVARDKLVDELLDRVATHGAFGIGELRDAVAKNQLKCEDLTARALLGRDELLSADRLLAQKLDGVYRRGEIYLRGLQKASSLAFGTRVGRVVSTGFVLPVLGAFVVLEGLQHIIGPLSKKLLHHRVHLLSHASWAALSAVLFVLLHVPVARQLGWAVLRAIGLALHAVFVGLPRLVLGLPVVAAVLRSAPLKLFSRWVLRPAVIAVPAFWVARRLHASSHTALVVALVSVPVASVVMNSPPFVLLSEVFFDAAARALRNLRTRVLPGIFAAILDAVRVLVDSVERLIYRIDEALLFREGESHVAKVFKGAGNVVWSVVTFVVRLYVNLLIEPQVNPIKHFPVVTVSHKILLPMVPTLLGAFRAPLLPLGPMIANTVAGTTVFLLPGVFGFLVWELKENRRLYRASLAETLVPARIGGHGETMTALLVPGFHSGTLPKIRQSLRRSGRRIARNDALLQLAVRSHTRAKTELHHCEEAVARFVEREMCALLSRTPRWTGPRVGRPEVHIGSNRVAVSLFAEGHERPFTFAFDEQSGFVLAHVAERGFVDALTDAQRLVLRDALAGIYALAAVDFVREELERAIGGAPYDVSDEGLVVWPDGSFKTTLVYDLHAEGTVEVAGGPPLDVGKLRCAEVRWDAWEKAWSQPDSAPVIERGIL